MSSARRDTEQCVYIRFQVSEDKVDSFRKMFVNATRSDFDHSLRGLSKDYGNLSLTFSFPSLGSNENAKRNFALALNAVFVKLFDFYPSISEKPSELQTAAAKHFAKLADPPSPAEIVSEQRIPAHVYN